mmetsp:Transcript_10499/g.23853  ORF Transcript_10499/g.23853 Transcript_10499/m.23853 type:complete len:672 (+) Transcript_10499:194-2209(+)
MTVSGASGVLPPTYAETWYKDLAAQSRACSTLPFTLLLWLVFIAQQVSHRQVEVGFNIQRMQKEFLEAPEVITKNQTSGCGEEAEEVVEASEGLLMREVYSLESPKSLLDWVEEKVVEAIWLPRSHLGDRAYTGHFNRVMGGIRMVQTRLKPMDCKGSDELKRFYGHQCYDPGAKDSANINGLDLEGFRANQDDEYVVWLDVARSRDEAMGIIEQLRDLKWLGPATSKVDMQMVHYNGEVTMFSLTRVEFTLDRTGYLSPKQRVTVWKSNVYASMSSIALDVVFWFMLMWLLFMQVRRVIKGIASRRLGEIINLQMTLNLAIVGIGFFSGIYFNFVNVALQALSEKVTEMPVPPQAGGSWEERQNHLDDMFDEFTLMQSLRDIEESVVFIYVLLLVCKFFRSFQVVPRLAIVADTLNRSASDVIHFMLVSGTIFLSFTTGAYFMFGAKLVEWSNWGKAMSTSFRALMGDFDFDAMYNVAPVSATIWFWSFMALIFLVMLNMLLAIILDTYNEVKADAPMMQGIYDIALDIVSYHWAKLRARPQDLMRCRAVGDYEEQVAALTRLHIPTRIAKHILKCLQEYEDAEIEESAEEDDYIDEVYELTKKAELHLQGPVEAPPLTKLAFTAQPQPLPPQVDAPQIVAAPPARNGHRPRPKEDIPVLPASDSEADGR